MVTVTIENLGDAGAEVPVMLKMEQGQVSKRLLVRGKSKAIIRIEAVSTPLEIVVNDGSVPESDMSNNVYKIELSGEKELKISNSGFQIQEHRYPRCGRSKI